MHVFINADQNNSNHETIFFHDKKTFEFQDIFENCCDDAHKGAGLSLPGRGQLIQQQVWVKRVNSQQINSFLILTAFRDFQDKSVRCRKL